MNVMMTQNSADMIQDLRGRTKLSNQLHRINLTDSFNSCIKML